MNAYDYFPRPRRYLGLVESRGYRLKRYAITFDGNWPQQDWQPAIDHLLWVLPQPAQTDVRPGVGVLIQHHGRGADYLVLAWWDNANELPLRLKLRDYGQNAWRDPRPHESVCVWDLEIIAAECNAYVATVLGGRGLAAVSDYLACSLESNQPALPDATSG